MGWWAVAQSTMWSFRVVLFPPLFDQDLCLTQAVEDFTVQELIPESGIEAFTEVNAARTIHVKCP